MSLPVLLLLSFLTVQCGGCDFDWESVNNIKATIDSNPTGFRTIFPKNYYVEHHYKSSMLCDTDPCCVFPAAIVLLDSWRLLLRNLWHEHLKHAFILDLIETLENVIKKNKHTESFQEETDLSHFPLNSTSPEDLLKLTSQLFSRWLNVGCSPSIETCPLPTLATSFVEKQEYGPTRTRLLSTRAVSRTEEGPREKMLDVPQHASNGGPLSLSFPASVWSLLLFRLYWWLLP